MPGMARPFIIFSTAVDVQVVARLAFEDADSPHSTLAMILMSGHKMGQPPTAGFKIVNAQHAGIAKRLLLQHASVDRHLLHTYVEKPCVQSLLLEVIMSRLRQLLGFQGCPRRKSFGYRTF